MKKLSASDLGGYFDHTFLKAAGDEPAIRRICREAKKYGFASVCVNPCDVALSARLLKSSKVKVCTVIGFPLGQNTVEIKIAEALDAIINGANELDIVVNQRLLKYAPEECLAELMAIAGFCRRSDPKVTLKLILECCNLSKDEIRLGCQLAMDAGFDFVKTSTGFASSGADAEDVKLMRKTVGRKIGVKAAGSIRTLDDAVRMIASGANRIGSSASVEIIKSLK